MLNPFDPNKDSGSYVSLQKRIFQRVQSSKINNQIIEVVRKSYEDAIHAENVELTRTESNRLLSQILKLVLEDLSKQVGGGSTTV
jgi:uncharacterized membrane protein YheB (UPF0754 family)